MRGDLLYEDKDISISLERSRGYAVCHCEIHKTAPSVLKRCRNTIARLHADKKDETAYAFCTCGDTKHQKFLALMGFKFFKNTWILDDQKKDKIIELWRREYA